jgi:hypothetical protein
MIRLANHLTTLPFAQYCHIPNQFPLRYTRKLFPNPYRMALVYIYQEPRLFISGRRQCLRFG